MGYIGIIDSGADMSVIDLSVAQLLGLNLTGKKEESMGVGGHVDTIDSEVQIKFSKGHQKFNMKIPVLILCDSEELGMMLLGRNGFFDKFTIKFDEKNKKFQLKRNK